MLGIVPDTLEFLCIQQIEYFTPGIYKWWGFNYEQEVQALMDFAIQKASRKGTENKAL